MCMLEAGGGGGAASHPRSFSQSEGHKINSIARETPEEIRHVWPTN